MFHIKEYSLRDLKKKFDERVFAIPKIQRSYVWKKENICKLADSIYNNYPIGIALVWSTKTSRAFEIRPNTKTIIPQYNKNAQIAEVIIDGQQRLSTIYGVLNGVQPSKDVNSKIDFNELYFDCNKRAEARFIFKRNTSDSKGLIKLKELLDTPPSQLSKRLRLKKYQAVEAKKCYNTFYSYKFNILEFSGFDFDQAREIFLRVNSAGMKLNRADEVFALTTEVSLRDHVEDTKKDLQNGFREVSDDAMQNTIALFYGAKKIGGVEFKSILNSKLNRKAAEIDYRADWKRIENGYKLCVDFLASEFRIANIKELPTSNIFSMLSFFFALNTKRASTYQIKQIRKWFWHTCMNKRYSGSEFNKNIPADIKFFRSLAQNKQVSYLINKKVNVYDFMRSDYREVSSLVIAYYLVLKSKKPLYLLNGSPMLLDNISSISNKKHRHHIFPKALLENNRVKDKWINCITNICFLEADQNSSISNSLPKSYLTKYKQLKHFKKATASHLIPTHTDSSVWSNKVTEGFLGFINERIQMIICEIEKLAGAKLFETFDGIKRL